ncbi:MAG: DUF5710 domain-containing protein [Steroidobacteraceae bacterium]
MDRTYLYVPPEESAAVRSAGARWDGDIKCWYIEPGDDPARFARWLGTDQGVEPTIVSDQAYVAVATVPCCSCDRPIEVICIYCETGSASGEPLTQFTVVDVLAMDEALARQLAPWPGFRPIRDPGLDSPRYANHCPHCGAEQDDRDLHTEPGEPFFDIPHGDLSAVRLTPLTGRVRMSGDEHFSIQ